MNENTTTETSKKSGAYGSDVSLQDKIMKQIGELGDSLERAGEKIEQKGWETIGQAIYKLGDTLEHLKDGKSSGKADKSFGGASVDKSFGSTDTQKFNGNTAASKPYTDREYDEKSKKFSDSTVSTDKVGGNDSQAY